MSPAQNLYRCVRRAEIRETISQMFDVRRLMFDFKPSPPSSPFTKGRGGRAALSRFPLLLERGEDEGEEST